LVFDYQDLEYIRINNIEVELSSKNILIIPPLDIFKEIKILQLIDELDLTKDNILEDVETSRKIFEIISFATDEYIDNTQDIYNIFSEIYQKIYVPIVLFMINEKIMNFIGTNKDKINVEEIKKDKEALNFPFLSLIHNVLSNQSIPNEYVKYLGLRYFIIMNRYIKINQQHEILKNISLLSDTALIANGNIDTSKMQHTPFKKMLDAIYEDLDTDRKENYPIIKDEKGNVIEMSGVEYFENYIKENNKGDK